MRLFPPYFSILSLNTVLYSPHAVAEDTILKNKIKTVSKYQTYLDEQSVSDKKEKILDWPQSGWIGWKPNIT